MKKRILPIVLVIAMVAVVGASVFYVNYNAFALKQNSEMREKRVEEYAEVLAKSVNTQKGDNILITADAQQHDFANEVAKKCYEVGADGVRINYTDKIMDDLQAKYLKDDKSDSYYYEYAISSYTEAAAPKSKMIVIVSQDFDEKQATKEESENYQAKLNEKARTFLTEHDLVPKNIAPPGDLPWVLAVYPTKNWAKKVYPELDGEAAYNKMLDDFLDFARTGQSEDFFAHSQKLTQLANKANELGIAELHYKSKTTDLRIPLHPKNKFAGGKVMDKNGVYYSPNVPTEEIFTMPTKYGANGTAAATRPFVLGGQLVEGLKMTFKDGKLVDYNATSGMDMLKERFESSPEGVYLGEAALVPKTSPVFQSNRVYYDTVTDENSGAHIALGRALVDYNLKEGAETDQDMNKADYHIDVTIGSEDLTVTATLTDGSQVDLIKNGLWNF
ncbi:MAG: aminopeptidase [Christensenella sp.]